VYCREAEGNSVDHYTPVAQGGAHDYTNVVPCCMMCNVRKRENEPDAWVTKTFGPERLEFVRSVMLK
jgi:5-methylcytosine-specific restriction endonuclease McrA